MQSAGHTEKGSLLCSPGLQRFLQNGQYFPDLGVRFLFAAVQRLADAAADVGAENLLVDFVENGGRGLEMSMQ